MFIHLMLEMFKKLYISIWKIVFPLFQYLRMNMHNIPDFDVYCIIQKRTWKNSKHVGLWIFSVFINNFLKIVVIMHLHLGK